MLTFILPPSRLSEVAAVCGQGD